MDNISSITQKYPHITIILSEVTLTTRKDDLDEEVQLPNEKCVNSIKVMENVCLLRDDNMSMSIDNKHIKQTFILRFSANIKADFRSVFGILSKFGLDPTCHKYKA